MEKGHVSTSCLASSLFLSKLPFGSCLVSDEAKGEMMFNELVGVWGKGWMSNTQYHNR